MWMSQVLLILVKFLVAAPSVVVPFRNLATKYLKIAESPETLVNLELFIKTLSKIQNEIDQEFKNTLTNKMTSAQIAKAQELSKQCLNSNYKECDQRVKPVSREITRMGIACYPVGHVTESMITANYACYQIWL